MFATLYQASIMEASSISTKNETEDYFNNSQTISKERDEYKIIIDRIQFFMTVIGFLGNVIVYVTLSKNGNLFTSPTILRLLKNQSILDSLVCFIGSIFVLQPPMWRTSNDKFSAFVCQVRNLLDIKPKNSNPEINGQLKISLQELIGMIL